MFNGFVYQYYYMVCGINDKLVHFIKINCVIVCIITLKYNLSANTVLRMLIELCHVNMVNAVKT